MDMGSKGRKLLWPGRRGGAGNKLGRKVKTLFPDFYSHGWYRKEGINKFTDDVLDALNGTFPAKILDLHEEKGSVQRRFVCNMLPDAPRSCQRMVANDERQKISIANTHASATTNHIHYDMLTTEAAELGLVDTERFQRKDIREAMWHYNEDELGKTPWDFDIECPQRYEAEELLSFSLALEEKVFGKEVAARMEAGSRAAFQQDFDGRAAFCHVNPRKSLTSEQWKSFFAQYAAPQIK
jgi:hypothetical protein